jgi:hypothetical protein
MYWSVMLVTVLWMLLCAATIIGSVAIVTHKKMIKKESKQVPTVVKVKAMAMGLLQSNTYTVDGVQVHNGDLVLGWVGQKSTVWKRSRNGWTSTDLLRKVMIGSIVQVVAGLQYAHTSFCLRSADRLVPLWQHWLLDSATIIKLFNDGNMAFVLKTTDNGRRMLPTSVPSLFEEDQK